MSFMTFRYVVPSAVRFICYQIHIRPANLAPEGLSENSLSYPENPDRAAHYRTLLATTKTALSPHANSAAYTLQVPPRKRRLLIFSHYLTRL